MHTLPVEGGLDADYWNGLGEILKDDLLSTQFENAISLCVRTVGASLARYYPAIS